MFLLFLPILLFLDRFNPWTTEIYFPLKKLFPKYRPWKKPRMILRVGLRTTREWEQMCCYGNWSFSLLLLLARIPCGCRYNVTAYFVYIWMECMFRMMLALTCCRGQRYTYICIGRWIKCEQNWVCLLLTCFIFYTMLLAIFMWSKNAQRSDIALVIYKNNKRF